MAIEPKPIDCAFMYLPVTNLNEATNKLFLAHNICNPVGYLPIVSTIAGIARIIFSVIFYQQVNNKSFKEFCKFNILRGCIELIPFSGLALLITDIVQANRFKQPA